MTWEETIEMIRTKEEFKDLVRDAYFDSDLLGNVERYKSSEEYTETIKIFNKYASNSTSILDIGSGNGISAVSFALRGYHVTAVEPDTSDTVGAGAIIKLKKHYKLDALKVHASLAEDINFENNTFDIVYIRQAMHHANDLDKFIEECVRVLKPKGLLLTVRDHVIYNEIDKRVFLDAHPLHKFYGGENAYTTTEYKNAIVKAGAHIVKELAYYDNVINYSPLTIQEVEKFKRDYLAQIKKRFVNKFGLISKLPLMFKVYTLIKGINSSDGLDEATIPGRMYTYIALKK